jgi:hypothetical protein
MMFRMKKYKLIILILVFLWFFPSLSAISRLNDSTEAYQYWAKRGIIEMVYAYMNDYIEAVGEEGAKKEEMEGRNEYYTEFVKEIDSKGPPSFDTVSLFLVTNSWPTADKKLLQPLLSNLKASAKLDSSFFTAKKPGSGDIITVIPGKQNKKVNWNSKCSEILKSYNTELQNIAKKNGAQIKHNKPLPIREIPVDSFQIESRNEKEIESIYKFNLFNLSLFIFGIMIGGLVIYLISRAKIYSILQYEKDKYLSDVRLSNERFFFKYIGLFHILKKSKDFYKNDYRKQESNSELRDIQEQLKKLQLDYEALEKKHSIPNKYIDSSDADNRAGSTHEWDVKHHEEAVRKLFFSMPESDGHFIINNGVPSNDGRMYYKIEYNKLSESGQLIYLSSDRDQRAINKLESYLKPVCEIENINNADSATQIEFISPGKVHLMDDRWVIDIENKVKIKLI